MRDSLGHLTPSASSPPLPTSYAKFREHAGDRITAAQLADEMTRLEAVYGAPKGRTEDLARVMANEWLRALGQFGRKSVHIAVSQIIAKSKWWPSISEVFELCDSYEDGWRDALGLKDRGRVWVAEERSFCRNGRTEAEEIAFRAAEVRRMKAAVGFGNAPDPLAAEPEQPKPASQAMWISDELRAHAQKHGYWRPG